MNKLVLATLAFLVFLACKKNNTEIYKVKYSVTGSTVDQFKISHDGTDNLVTVPFSGTKDTVLYLPAGTVLKLDAKASGSKLSGVIYINDALAASLTDADPDGDNKTQVKVDYTILK